MSPGANLASTVGAASAGSVLCLKSGSYGSVALKGILKNPRVTIRSASGQDASFELDISGGTSGVTVDSVKITGGSITGSTTRNITIRNSAFTGSMTFLDLANSNVLLDHNTHNNIEGGGQFVSPARLHLAYSGSVPSGVTIQNSLMDGGSADGVQTGTGVNILNNEFRNIHEGSCSDCHTDAIQLLGASGSVIRGNYIHNVSTGIVAFDGVERATIEDNVVDTGGRPWGIELYADSGSIVRHNTLLYRANCDYNMTCGTIALDRKPGDPAGRGTIIDDNIATSIEANDGSTYAERSHNLVRAGAVADDISGSPSYVGGSIPATWAGFRLASSSPGARGASDGSDVGAANFGATQSPAPSPAPSPAASSSPDSTAAIPLGFDSPLFGQMTKSDSLTFSPGAVRSNLSIEVDGPSASVAGSDFTLKNSRIRSSEAIRAWGSAGAGGIVLDGVYAEAKGVAGDHADVLQCYDPNASNSIVVRNSTFRAYDENATAGLFWADSFAGSLTLENVVFWGGPFGLRMHADGKQVTLSMKDVYFVGPFAYSPTLIDSNLGGKIKIVRWENVRSATIVNGKLVPGALMPAPN